MCGGNTYFTKPLLFITKVVTNINFYYSFVKGIFKVNYLCEPEGSKNRGKLIFCIFDFLKKIFV